MPERLKINDLPHEFFEGTRKNIHDVLFQAGVDDMVKKYKVRYRPSIVEAIKIDSNHLVLNEDGSCCQDGQRKRSTGWLIKGPNDVVFYLPVEQFREWFDIVKEERNG